MELNPDLSSKRPGKEYSERFRSKVETLCGIITIARSPRYLKLQFIRSARALFGLTVVRVSDPSAESRSNNGISCARSQLDVFGDATLTMLS